MKLMSKIKRSALAGLAVGAALASGSDRAEAGIEPYVGDIVAVAYTYCPYGWVEANGQTLMIAQNPALFSLYGTTYGGNGTSTFGLPDLRARAAMGQGNGAGLTPRVQGEVFGSQTQTLTAGQLPSHSHSVNATNSDGDFAGPAGKLLAAAPNGGSGNETIYSDQPANRTMSPEMIANSGSGMPISTQDPSLVLRYCVAVQGVFPQRP